MCDHAGEGGGGRMAAGKNAGNGGKKGGKNVKEAKEGRGKGGGRNGNGNGSDDGDPPKTKVCKMCANDIFNVVVCAVKTLSTEHKVSMEEILEFIKKDYELPMSDCQFYVEMEQQLIKAVACGVVCVRMGKYYAQGMKPPSNYDLKNPHCHVKPFPPPECPSADDEDEDEEDEAAGGKKGGGGGGGGGGGDKNGKKGGKNGAGGAAGGGKGGGKGGKDDAKGGKDGKGGKEGGKEGGKGGKDGGGKGGKDGGNGGVGKDGGGGGGCGKCKCECLPVKGKGEGGAGCEGGAASCVGDPDKSKGCHGDQDAPHLDRLALRRTSFKPSRSTRMPLLHPVIRKKLQNALRETPPTLYNYRGRNMADGDDVQY